MYTRTKGGLSSRRIRAYDPFADVKRVNAEASWKKSEGQPPRAEAGFLVR
jgi:hypothetical protein